MKNALQLIGYAVIAATFALLTGCATSVRDNVPATQISGYLGGKPFAFTGPKGLTMTNFVAEVVTSTNGIIRATHKLGSVSAAVDPNVITMTGQAYSTMRAADSALINGAISSASAAIGSAAGSAAAAGVTGK